MKKFLKFSSLAIGLSLSANALAADAVGAFQWVGTVPVDTPTNGLVIVNKGTVEFDSGSIIFQEDPSNTGEYYIQDSSTMVFNVEFDDGSAIASYDYTVQTLSFQAGGGFHSPVDPISPEFALQDGNGTLLNIGDALSVSDASIDQTLQVVTPSNITAVSAGDEVVVHATVLVDNPL